MTLNQSGQFQLADFFRTSLNLEGNFSQDYSAYSSQASVFGTTPIDIEVGGEAEETGFIIIENAALLNTNNPLSNIVPTREGVFIYKVQKGDTVPELPLILGFPLIRFYGPMRIYAQILLKPGQEIIVWSVTGILHHIEEGETLDDISNRYTDVPAQRIINANPGLIPAKLSSLSTIIIPDTRPLQTSS